MNTILEALITKVVCVDETNGSFVERFGNDEISLGGFAVNNNAVSTKIAPFTVSNSFDDGDVKKYSPPKVFASFPLGNIVRPANFSVGFLLAEVDGGGFSDAVKKIFEKLVAEISKKKAELESKAAAAAATPASHAGAVAFAPVAAGLILSTIWPLVKPYVYSYIKDKILGYFNDDLFPLHDVSTTITGPNHTWNGSNTSPEAMVEFRGNDGVYQLYYEWRLR